MLLPALDGVDTVDLQVSIACQKAGIAPGQDCDLRRFVVTRYRQGDRPLGDADQPCASAGD